MESKLKASVNGSLIVLEYGQEIIVIRKCTDNLLYREVKGFITAVNKDKLVRRFTDIKDCIEKHTDNSLETYEFNVGDTVHQLEEPLLEEEKPTSKKALKVKVCDKAFKKYIKQFTDMKAKDVVKFIDEEFGIKLEYSIKSKASIVQAAAKIVANSEELNK